MRNYHKTKFSWVIAVEAPEGTSDTQLVGMAREKIRTIYPNTIVDGQLHLGDVIETVITRKPQYKIRLTQCIMEDIDITEEEMENPELKPWLICFDQEASVPSRKGASEDEYIAAAHEIIVNQFLSIEDITGTGEYPNIEENIEKHYIIKKVCQMPC